MHFGLSNRALVMKIHIKSFFVTPNVCLILSRIHLFDFSNPKIAVCIVFAIPIDLAYDSCFPVPISFATVWILLYLSSPVGQRYPHTLRWPRSHFNSTRQTFSLLIDVHQSNRVYLWAWYLQHRWLKSLSVHAGGRGSYNQIYTHAGHAMAQALLDYVWHSVLIRRRFIKSEDALTDLTGHRRSSLFDWGANDRNRQS